MYDIHTHIYIGGCGGGKVSSKLDRERAAAVSTEPFYWIQFYPHLSVPKITHCRFKLLIFIVELSAQCMMFLNSVV